MNSFNNIKWKDFFLNEIFTIESTSSGIDKNKLIKGNGIIPYITRSEKNNAYDSFISMQEKKYLLNKSNVITIGLDTQTVHYQPYKFYTGQNIQILYNNDITKYSAMFIIPLLKKVVEKFNWGSNGATLTRLRRSKIMLPITLNNKPDFEFMHEYMKDIEKNIIFEYKKYAEKNTNYINEIDEIGNKNWAKFIIEDIFDIIIGKNVDGNKINKNGGMIAYITRKENNNGLDGFINADIRLLNIKKPVITIGNETAEPFVHTYSFFTGTKVNILIPKKVLSKYSLLYIANCIKKHKSKYSYSYTINSTRLKKQIIILPINENSEPDYEFMEEYMRYLEYKKIQNYIEYKIR